MQAPYVKIGLRGNPRTILAVCLVAWLAVVAAVAVLPTDSTARSVTAVLVFCAAAFAVGSSGYAASVVSVKGRLFWSLLGSGLLLRFAGYLSWLGLRESPSAAQDALVTQAMYTLSYALLFAAMLYLAALATRRIAWISALDAIAVALSFGTLTWLFAIGPSLTSAGTAEIIGAVSRPALDASVLYMALVIISAPTGRGGQTSWHRAFWRYWSPARYI